MWVHLDKDVLLCVNVHLEHPCSVEGAIQEHHQALVGDIRTGTGDIPAMLHKLAPVVFTVYQLKLLVITL